MKLASFFADGRERFGALFDGHIVDFTSHAAGSLKAICGAISWCGP